MTNSYESLDQLITLLDEIKASGSGSLSYPKALYLIANELKKLIDKSENKHIEAKNETM